MAISETGQVQEPQPLREVPFHIDVLRHTERQDLLALGIEPNVVKSVDRKRIGISEIPTGYFVELTNGQHKIRGNVYTEIDVEMGDGTWTGRAHFFPQDATKNGEAVDLPGFTIEDGYQILIHSPASEDETPMTIRIDSVCKTSMYDGGHISSAGEAGLGCDCSGQRNKAKKAIMRSPRGLSILSPMEGRGNGQRVHVQQIQVQNFMKRTGLEVLDTFETVEALGHKRDSRPDLYFLEALIIIELLGIDKINLLSNNPEKIAALQEAGIEVSPIDLIDTDNPNYYQGINAKAKAEGGHSGLARVIDLFRRDGGNNPT